MSDNNYISTWKFIEKKGRFVLEQPHKTSGLYFPLANEAGMMSSITPTLNGDIKINQNTFLMAPVSIEDLSNNVASRNFWLKLEDGTIWSATGNSPTQKMFGYKNNEVEHVTLEAGFLWHTVIRESANLRISSQITNFIPANNDTVELMKVKIVNHDEKEITFVPTAAIPIYGRSADHVRDHRHVTSLLNSVRTNNYGVIVKPTMTFDEKGHSKNNCCFSIQAVAENGLAPIGFFPVLEDFIGEGGSLDWPNAIIDDKAKTVTSNYHIDGYEAIGAIRFSKVTLLPGEEKTFIIIMGISSTLENVDQYIERYGSLDKFEKEFQQNCSFWEQKLAGLSFKSADNNFDLWLKWVELQPILRRIFGCSFLPHHDYGKGGRGWRDLWQDCLALLLLESGQVRDLLINNYAGVRIDGSNATIIGTNPGEFIADRNNIQRTWMDHGAWPYFTTKLYLDLSGDLDFLMAEQSYYKDRQIKRSKDIDTLWQEEHGTKQVEKSGEVYKGSILEHILLQQITPFYNVGEHNNIKLEGGDWNDGLDMATEKGESVAFTCLYGSNLLDLSKLVMQLKEIKGIHEIELASEILVLLDSISGKIDYNIIEEKHELLEEFFCLCSHKISGTKIKVKTEELARDLELKALWIFEHIRNKEWIKSLEGYEWFNGYYDDRGIALEGDFESSVRMTLTGQVFPIMGGIADEAQVQKIIASVNRYLREPAMGGIRLNTNFNEVKLDMGRCFGFAFGHKENGAMFSHMSIMYVNALYKRGFVKDGYEILKMIYQHCSDFEKSKIYPGIPEYINEKGRGMYHYLTGSASWLLLTMRSEVYGIKGELGDMLIQPKLVAEQFDDKGISSITTIFKNIKFNIEYVNKDKLEYMKYSIGNVLIDGQVISRNNHSTSVVIKADFLTMLDKTKEHTIRVELI